MTATRKTGRIVAARMLSPSVRSLKIAPDEGPLAFEAGQWVDLYVATPDGVEKRAYSIANGPGEPELEIAVTLVPGGAASGALHAVPEGSQIELAGPFGLFTRDAALRSQPGLFVATGTGLSPLRSMLYAWREESLRASITLLFGVRTQADILWREQLERLAQSIPELRVEVTLSRPDAAWTGRRGYVQEHVAELVRDLGAPHVFICGLNRMVSEVRALCKNELGFERKHIHSERYD